MMKNSLLIIFSTLLIISCKKNSPINPSDKTTFSNPFGVLVNDTTPGTNNTTFKLAVSDQYGVPYLRYAILLSTWNGANDAGYDARIAKGYKMILNVNNDRAVAGNPAPFPTDIAAYKAKLSNLLSVYRPESIVVENEENTYQYHTGPLSDYISELQAAIDVAHQQGLKVTNGGITSEIFFLVWKDYMARGLTDSAANFASRTMSPSVIADLPALANHPYLAGKVSNAEYLISQYKILNLDFVNLHWYEPIADNFSSTASFLNMDAFKETVNYLKRATGKNVITNEYGQDNMDPAITSAMMQAILDIKMPYAIWYDGDGTSARGLHETGTTTLRSTGIAFKNFIAEHF